MSSFHRKYGPTRSSSIGGGMLSLIIAKPTSAPVWASCTAQGWGIARCSSSASAKISAIELRYWSWPGPRRRPMTAARSPSSRCRATRPSPSPPPRHARASSSVGDPDLAPPAAAGARLGGLCGSAAAVDDVGAPQVPQRVAPRVHQAAERPDGPDGPGGGGVDLVDDRRRGHGRNVGLAAEQAAEPGGHRGAVVVAVAEQVDEERGRDAGQDDDQQQDQRDPVDGGGGGPDPRDEQPPAGQHHHPRDNQDRGERSGGGGEPAVGALRDADGAGPGLGDQDADDVAGDGRERAVVED